MHSLPAQHPTIMSSYYSNGPSVHQARNHHHTTGNNLAGSRNQQQQQQRPGATKPLPGVTAPLSTAESTAREKEQTEALVRTLVSHGQYEPEEECSRRYVCICFLLVPPPLGVVPVNICTA
jgi:hypothetical protein